MGVRKGQAHLALILTMGLQGVQAETNCFVEAGQRYGVDPHLLYAIAKTESSLNCRAVNKNKNGTRDFGCMQINETHLPRLSKYGIGIRELFDPCTNISVGAWILAENFARHGVTWDAVGAYNAGGKKNLTQHNKRMGYAWKVFEKYKSKDAVPKAGSAHFQPPRRIAGLENRGHNRLSNKQNDVDAAALREAARASSIRMNSYTER